MQKIETTVELNALIEQHRAVVFLWVEWAIHARHSAKVAKQFIDRWNRQHPKATITLSKIDVSEQSGKMWDSMTDWLESQDIPDATGLLYGGAGAIIWIRSGKIVRYVVNAAANGVDGLLVTTDQVLGTVNPNNAT